MNSPNDTVVKLARSQVDPAIELAAQAFLHDPIQSYFYAEAEAAKLATLRWLKRLILDYCQPYGQIYTTPGDPKGVAAWLPPGAFPLSDWRLLRMGFYTGLPFKIRLSRVSQFLQLFRAMETYHHQDMPEPHWFLFLLGVAPNFQSQGIGSALLQPVLAQADRDGIPCYLETSTDRAVRFYQKQGFDILRTRQITEHVPPFWTMKRDPQR